MTTYNWDLIERLLHEVHNGEGSFAPRKYAEQEAAEKATAGESIGNLDALKKTAADYEALLFKRGFIESRPEEEGGNGENFILTPLGAQLLALIDSSIQAMITRGRCWMSRPMHWTRRRLRKWPRRHRSPEVKGGLLSLVGGGLEALECLEVAAHAVDFLRQLQALLLAAFSHQIDEQATCRRFGLGISDAIFRGPQAFAIHQ